MKRPTLDNSVAKRIIECGLTAEWNKNANEWMITRLQDNMLLIMTADANEIATYIIGYTHAKRFFTNPERIRQ